MEKYKICPICGEKNSPGLLECRICEADLTGVGVSTLEETNTIHNESGLVRICDCGYPNPPQARKCQACGEDISDVIPVPMPEEESVCRLYSLDGSYIYEICGESCEIGREAEMKDYLKDFPYVGRMQAKIVISGDEARIFHLSGTNPTFVNQVQVPEEGTVLKDHDEIGLGGKEIRGQRQEKAAYLTFRRM